MSTDHQEVEWQFDAGDLAAVARWLREQPADAAVQATFRADAEQNDTYFDTDDWRILRAGYALRVRRSAAGGAEATLKSLHAAEKGVRQRREINEALGGDGSASDIAAAPGAVGQRVRAIAGPRRIRALRAIFEVHTRRSVYELTCGGEPAGEVDLDSTDFPGDGAVPGAVMQRVEVEVNDPPAHTIRAFVKRMRKACGLRNAALSKFEAGLNARRLQPREIAGEDFGPTQIDADSAVGDLAYAALRQNFAAMLAHEPAVRLGESAHDVHQMRVATRRLRAGLSLLKDLLPAPAAKLRGELSRLAAALGALRDHDVMLSQVEAWAGESDAELAQAVYQPVAALLAESRSAEYGRLLEFLNSPRYERLLAAFTRFLKTPAALPDTAREPAREVMPPAILRRYRRLRRLGDRLTPQSPPADYHRARIAAKRLRYSLEFVTSLYGKPARRALARMVALQDMLGLYQDTHMAVARLRAMSALPQRPPQALFALGQTAQQYEQQAAMLLKKFPAAYAKMRGSDWRRLKKALRKSS